MTIPETLNTDTARWTITPADSDYPAALSSWPEPPTIYGYGNRNAMAFDRYRAVAIVGSRRASAYGREVSYSMANQLADDGVTVVSGMALGIDGAAHRGALQAGGACAVAVLVDSADVAYPRSHRLLHEQIAREGCAISLTPFGGDGKANGNRDARRQAVRLLASLVELSILVEGSIDAEAHNCVSLTQANGARFGAVPGPVTGPCSAGPNAFLAGGIAEMIRDAADVRAKLGLE
jgi:DNA processing protein